MKCLSIFFASLVLVLSATANVQLPGFFSNNMVLQRDKPIPVWGRARSYEKIIVRFNKQLKKTVADKQGKWVIKLQPEKAGGPYQLIIAGKNSITITNVLVGEVWICSGQSNMQMPIAGWGQINDYGNEIANANYPEIRQLYMQNTLASLPQSDASTTCWAVCSPQTAGDFTATGYFFARQLYKELKVPIGIINTSWGGTVIEGWISRQAFENSSEFKSMINTVHPKNIDRYIEQKSQELKINIKKLQDTAKQSAAELPQWKENTFDDSRWQKINVPGIWEDQELDFFDGIAWFRRTVFINAADAGKPAVLKLSMINDVDETFINGIKIGSTTGFITKRTYNVPAGVLKEGMNIIAVRVVDDGGPGGFSGTDNEIKLITASSEQSLAGNWQFKIEQINDADYDLLPNTFPTMVFNAMINPLIPFAIRGVIWYQGEANAERAFQYRTAFPLMIKDWRKRFQQGNFPFYFAQLSSWKTVYNNNADGVEWPEMREAQASVLSLPNTGMAVTTDIGDAKDIHPKNKQEAGRRLALIALNKTYHTKIVCSGPVFQSYKIDRNKIIISFSHTGSGLMVKAADGYLKGVAIAGADKKFTPAKAFIKDDKIVVYNTDVNIPLAVRYGWTDDATEINLYNKEGLPAAPFRTDNWKGFTEGVKYSCCQ